MSASVSPMTLMTAFEWSDLLGITIIDPDGWRKDKKSMYELITREDYMARMSVSTISGLNNL